VRRCARCGVERASALTGGGLLVGLRALVRLVGLLVVLLGRALAVRAVALPRAPAVVGRVEAGALEVDRDRVQDLRQRRRTADLAYLGVGIGDPVEYLEEMPVRTPKLVDRHGRSRLAGRSAASGRA